MWTWTDILSFLLEQRREGAVYTMHFPLRSRRVSDDRSELRVGLYLISIIKPVQVRPNHLSVIIILVSLKQWLLNTIAILFLLHSLYIYSNHSKCQVFCLWPICIWFHDHKSFIINFLVCWQIPRRFHFNKHRSWF